MQGSKTEIMVGAFVLAAIAIFIYMGFQIGAFRFDRSRYNMYTIFFKDISGLSRKADVKIAGVKVGWVEDIRLHTDHTTSAEVQVAVQKEYALYNDAYALVRQQGLIGPNYVEIITGDPLHRRLQGGETLSKPTVDAVSLDELLQQFKRIAVNVEDVTDSFRDAVGGTEGKNALRAIFDNVNHTAEKLASFSDVLERSFTRNEENINDILALGKDFRRLAEKLENDILPTFKDGIVKISNALDRDISRVADRLEATGHAVEEASLQAREGLKSLTSVAEKIDEGKGLLGKLVNEDETYKDLKVAVSGLKNYFTKVDRLQVVLDTHFESMHRPGEHYNHEDAKGFFDIRVHPTQDYFYIFQIASSEKGFVKRYEIFKEYFDTKGHPVDSSALPITDATKLENTWQQRIQVLNRDTVRFGIQFGKIFKDVLALRFGLFEGYAGVGVDFDIPFGTDKFRWVTTLEVYDVNGRQKLGDRRPHVKWLNRMFFMRNVYLTFGADDFASRYNSNVFLGGGIRFGDDDIKFLLSSLSGVSGMGGGSSGITTGGTLVTS